MDTETIKIDDRFTYAFTLGQIDVLSHGVVVSTDPQASNALICAAGELEQHREAASTLRTLLPTHTVTAFEAPVLSSVHVEGGKYTIVLKGADARRTTMLRFGQPWFATGDLDLPELWFAIAYELDTARRRTEALMQTVLESGQSIPDLPAELV